MEFAIPVTKDNEYPSFCQCNNSQFFHKMMNSYNLEELARGNFAMRLPRVSIYWTYEGIYPGRGK